MTVYFDKENLLSLIRSDPDFFRSDAFRLIKNHLNVILCSDSIDEPSAKSFFKQLNTGRGQQLKQNWGYQFARPLGQEFYKTDLEATKRGVFLLNDIEIEKIKEKGNILIDSYNETYSIEEILLSKLIFKDYNFSKLLMIGKQMKSYSDLNQFCLPCQDIIIQDKFLFEKDEATVWNNLNKLLNTVLSQNKSQINLVVYAQLEYDDFALVNQKVKNAIKGITGFDPNFTLIRAKKNHLLKKPATTVI